MLEEQNFKQTESKFKVDTPPNLENLDLNKNDHKFVKIILWLLIILVLLLSAGGTFTYFKYLRGPLILKNAMVKMQTLKSFSFATSIKSDVKKITPENLSDDNSDASYQTPPNFSEQLIEILSGAILNLDGKVDFNNEVDKKAVLNLDLSISEEFFPFGLPKASLVFSKEENFLKFYAMPTDFLFDLSSIDGQWIKLDIGELNNTVGEATAGLVDVGELVENNIGNSGLSTISALTTGLDYENNKEKINYLLKKIILSRPVNIKIEGAELVGLQPTKKISVSLNKVGIKKSWPYIKELIVMSTESEVVAEEEQLFLQAVESIDDSNPFVYFWIGDDNYIYRSSFILSLNKVLGNNSSDYRFDLQADILLNDHNLVQEITIPSDGKTFTEIYNELVVGMIDNPVDFSETDYVDILNQYTNSDNYPQNIQDRVLTYSNLPSIMFENDNDGDGLSDGLEWILGTNIFAVDSDDDGYDDFQEINNQYNPNGSGKLPTEMADVLKNSLFTSEK